MTAPLHVLVSHVHVDPRGSIPLEQAFRGRLHEVEGAPGFVRLEVWRDESADGAYLMVTWWRDPSDVRAYLRSEAHHRSHARIPTVPHRPRGAGLDRYTLVAE